MALQSLLDTTSLRSLQILGGADSLLSDPTDSALHGGDRILPQSLVGSLPLEGLTDHASVLPAVDGIAAAAPVLQNVESLLGDAASTGGVNAGAIGTVNSVASAIEGIGLQGLETLANETILDVHAALEAASHSTGVPSTIHAVTNLGETIGLGKIGGDNFLTHILAAPTALLHGDLSPLESLPHDLSGIVTATQGLLTGVETDLANGDFLSDPVGHLTDAVSQITTAPLTSLANDLVGTIHTTLEGALDPVLPGTIHGVIGIGNGLGLGELNGDNLLTHVTELPTSVLHGDLSPVGQLPGDIGTVVGAVGSALDGVGSDLGGGLLGGVTNPTTGGGLLGGVLPGQGTADGLLGQVEGLANGAGDTTGHGGLTQAVTGALDGVTGGQHSLVGDLLHVPSAFTGAVGDGTGPLPGDAGATAGSLGSIVGAVGHEVSGAGGGTGGLLAPLEGALHGTDGLTGVLNGGGTDGLVGTATGLLGGGSGSGSHDLAMVAVGPQTPTSGTSVDLLSQGNGQTHLADSHVGTVGASTPTVATVGLLSGDSLHIPATGGGSDALSGVFNALSGSGAPSSGGADAHAGIDLGVAHIDLPIGAVHANPLEALGAAVHPG